MITSDRAKKLLLPPYLSHAFKLSLQLNQKQQQQLLLPSTTSQPASDDSKNIPHDKTKVHFGMPLGTDIKISVYASLEGDSSSSFVYCYVDMMSGFTEFMSFTKDSRGFFLFAAFLNGRDSNVLDSNVFLTGFVSIVFNCWVLCFVCGCFHPYLWLLTSLSFLLTFIVHMKIIH